RLRSAAAGQRRDTRAVPRVHRPGERETGLGVERGGVAVVVARERWSGRRRPLRDDGRAQSREQLHEEGTEAALGHLSAHGESPLWLQLDELDRLVHQTRGKSPCSRRYATTPPAERICCANDASGCTDAAPPGARSSPAPTSSVTSSPSRTISTASADSIAGMPRLMQLRKKMRAKLFATTAPTPSFFSAATAYSRDEPQPKFSPPTRMSPGRTSFAKPGRASQNAY